MGRARKSLAVGADAASVVVAVMLLLLGGEAIWPLDKSSSAVPKDLLSLVWTDFSCRCSSHRYSLSSARFKRALLPRWVRNLVRMVPKHQQNLEKT
jgi:hypothetical protein